MAKKTSKKAQSQAETTEAPELQNDESAPPTIVESSESEVFEQTQEQADRTMEQVETTIQEKEQPAAKPLKPLKRPYIALVQGHLETGDMTKKDLLELILNTYPEVSKGGASTFLTDLKNSKYCHFKPKEVRQLENGKLIFTDKVSVTEAAKQEPAGPIPVEAETAAPTQAEQPEQQGE